MPNQNSRYGFLLISFMITLGLLGCGYFISQGFYHARVNRPYITVKGLAERQVKADLAVWSINYSVGGDDITTINTELLRQQLVIQNYLKEKGFTQDELSLDQIKLTDRYASYSDKPAQRYSIKGGVIVRTKRVDLVHVASQTMGELVGQGVAIGDDVNPNPAYYYTGLNGIRPAMLSEATRSAKRVAAQFAHDSESYLGTIRRANQGVFEIMSLDAIIYDSANEWQLRRDEQASVMKKIRLVSTIDYYLDK